MTNTSQTPKEQLLDAALIHVAFDGLVRDNVQAAVRDTGMDPTVAPAAVCSAWLPLSGRCLSQTGRSRPDYWTRMDSPKDMRPDEGSRPRSPPWSAPGLKLRQTRKRYVGGTTLFTLPQYAPGGPKLIWRYGQRHMAEAPIWATTFRRRELVHQTLPR